MIPLGNSGIERPISCEIHPLWTADEPQVQLKGPGDINYWKGSLNRDQVVCARFFPNDCGESTYIEKKSKLTWSKSARIGKTKVVLTGDLRVSGVLLLLCLPAGGRFELQG